MSMTDIYSWWRCPNCQEPNRYNLTWQHFYKFAELPNDRYSKEKCQYCGKEYYVDATEPGYWCFRLTKGPCKNDYVRDMVLDLDTKLTIIDEYDTT